MPLLEAHNVSRSYHVGGKCIVALPPVSLQVPKGEFMIISGPSGSGKSTLLHLLSGLDHPTTGDILFKGKSIVNIKAEEIDHLRNKAFGFIFQLPHLLMDRTILENILLPFHYCRQGKSAQNRARCQKLLEYVGLDDFANRFPNTLSGGEMQRVVFARALVMEPEIIFADEPTGSLDADNSMQVLDLLEDQVTKGRTVVLVTHDPLVMKRGGSFLRLDKFSGNLEN